ncbi:MAG: oxidoreductase, partial [Eubacterium sp.]|nr:oxidoreductase [Eubacterium sp.]
MEQTRIKLPVYTGDVSGSASALYELGGMIVIHDPSGCNSTYNTHDEVRWYDKESLLFISGLTDRDAISGNDGKLINDIIEAARYYKPAFIAIVNSPVPWLIGTDFDAICRAVEEQTGIPAFYIPTNAMHDYICGAGQAFSGLARKLFCSEKQNRDIASSIPADTGKSFSDLSEKNPVRTDTENAD